MDNFEKLGVFYLGRPYDLEAGKAREGYLLYDSKDLTTHGVCVGMTGSGKTGLCIGLLEEAAMDGIPAIIIDPKGDMANLLLTFPELRPEDFRPWINESDARKKGQTPDEFAAAQADLWKKGLASWGQDGSRIRRMRENAAFTLYTPGSTAGIPVSILRSFSCPPASVLEDGELLREQVSGTAASLLGLVGLDADPVRSRDHILLSTIILDMWQQGQDLDLAALIGLIQNPPVDQIGVMPLESFYPSKERFSLALLFNNLLASPGFANWLSGDPLDINQILYTPAGKPKISIFSIAHLSEAERMFFVSLMLNQVLSWTRTLSGTSSLRAILYMDEIYGYFPPVANPPSKQPLLTLLKQARAFGLGIMLTTQNPVDLDYKGLSNTGTWFIGRLQTERDKMRVLEGLEGASSTQGMAFDRARMEQVLAGLGNRVFLMNNVHDDQPTLFQTRWAMSYLRGPLTRTQIQQLAPAAEAVVPPTMEQSPGAQLPIIGQPQAVATAPVSPSAAPSDAGMTPPVLPQDIRQYFMPVRARVPSDQSLRYKPMVLGHALVGFRNTRLNVAHNKEFSFITPVTDNVFAVDWNDAQPIDMPIAELEDTPLDGARFDPLPKPAIVAKNYTGWSRDLSNWIYRNQQLTLLQSPALKMTSDLDESERDFKIRLDQSAREFRDAEVEKLRAKYTTRMKSLEEKIRKSEQAAEREKEQAKQQKLQTAISFGATLLSSFLGSKRVTASSVGKATTAIRGASRSLKEKGDVDRSLETVETYKQHLADLETQFEQESEALAAKLDAAHTELVPVDIRPTKQNIQVRIIMLVWMPYLRNEDGSDEPAWS